MIVPPRPQREWLQPTEYTQRRVLYKRTTERCILAVIDSDHCIMMTHALRLVMKLQLIRRDSVLETI